MMNADKKVDIMILVKRLEVQGIEPCASRMRSERSTK